MVTGANKGKGFNLYGGLIPEDVPRYTRTDVERATDVPASTIGVWTRGMPTNRKGAKGLSSPVIALPDPNDPRLSFNNVLEVNALRALRKQHDVKLQTVRDAIENAQRDLNIDRLLIHPNLRTSGGRLFLDYYFRLVELSNAKQLAMRAILEHSLQRVEYDEEKAARFFPVPRFMPRDERPILVSPYVAFGNAILDRRGVTTYAVRSRFDSGEDKAAIIADYDLTEAEFQEAIQYEEAA